MEAVKKAMNWMALNKVAVYTRNLKRQNARKGILC